MTPRWHWHLRISENSFLICLISLFLLKTLLFTPSTSNWAQNVLNVELKYSKRTKKHLNLNTFKEFLILAGLGNLASSEKLGNICKFSCSAWISGNLSCRVRWNRICTNSSLLKILGRFLNQSDKSGTSGSRWSKDWPYFEDLYCVWLLISFL